MPAGVPSTCTGPGAQNLYVECAKGEPEKGEGQETDTGKEETPEKEEEGEEEEWGVNVKCREI